MSGILDYFSDWMNQVMTIQQKTSIYEKGKLTTDRWDDIVGLEAVQCALYTGRVYSSIISGRIKDNIDATIVLNPESLSGATLKDTMRGVIDGIPYYFLDPDTIMRQGEVITISVSEEDRST